MTKRIISFLLVVFLLAPYIMDVGALTKERNVSQREAVWEWDFSENITELNGESQKVYGETSLIDIEDKNIKKAAFFDGDGDYIECGRSINLTENFTLNAYICCMDVSKKYSNFFAKYETNNKGPYAFSVNKGKINCWITQNDGSHVELESKTRLQNNEWYFFSFVKKGNSIEIYINGNLESHMEVPSFVQNDDVVTIGRQALLFEPEDQLQFTGYIGNISIYETALDQENIRALSYFTRGTDSNIPGNILTWGGHSYAIFDNCGSWNEAKEYCELLGGYLANISSAEENSALFDYMKSCGYSNAYFGYSDHVNEGYWCWTNDELHSYTNWRSTEPNRENQNEDYAMFYYKFNDGTWNDGDFNGSTVNGEQNFICEWGSVEVPGNDLSDGDETPEKDPDNSSGLPEEGVSLTQSQLDWIEKHIKYAGSAEFKSQVINGFQGAVNDAYKDVKENCIIKSYRTLDSINKMLDFDLDLSEVEEYEILLAQILFSRSGTESIKSIYQDYYNQSVLNTAKVLVEGLPEIDENAKKILGLIDRASDVIGGDTSVSEIVSQILEKTEDMGSFDFETFVNQYEKGFGEIGGDFFVKFIANEIESGINTYSEFTRYIAVCDAYQNTSETFADMILYMRKQLNVPSEDSRFKPFENSVNSIKIMAHLGLLPDNHKEKDPLNCPVSLNDLAKALENFYIVLEKNKQGDSEYIAEKALMRFTEESADNMLDVGIDVSLKLFESISVIKTYDSIKKLFNGTQFVIDNFTKIDERSYLGTMVLRLEAMAYVQSLTVYHYADSREHWGEYVSIDNLSEGIIFDEAREYMMATAFDEAVSVYRSILMVATEYAVQYYTTYYQTIDKVLNGKVKKTVPELAYAEKNSEMFKSLKVKILELQNQQIQLSYEWCHANYKDYCSVNNIIQFDDSDMIAYSFKCPVTATFKSPDENIIAVLDGQNDFVEEGYEQYFFTSEVINGSREYLKIGMVPEDYIVEIAGYDEGRMDVSVSYCVNNETQKTWQYFGIPIYKGSEGCVNTDPEDFQVVLDDREYTEGEYYDLDLSSIEKKDESLGVFIFIAVSSFSVFAGIVVAICLIVRNSKKQKKSSKNDDC